MLDIELEETRVENVGRKVEKAQKKRMEDAGMRGFAFSQEQVPEDRGTLRHSGFEPEWDGNILRWGYRADHAWPTEEGTQPYWAPIEPLLNWAERVTGDRGFGYYVQQKIATEGIDAQPYARPGREVMKRHLKSNSLGDYLSDEF